MKSENILRALRDTFTRLNRPMIIVETGTIRNIAEQYKDGDGHSTRHIAEWVRDVSPVSKFTSIDLNTKTAESYMRDLKLDKHVSFMTGNSLVHLGRFDRFDFVYLDSENDADLTFGEFLLVWDKVSIGGCVMVDDCDVDSRELFKGDKLIPYLISKNIGFEKIGTQIVIEKKNFKYGS